MKHLAVLFAGFAISTTALQAQTASPSGVPESHRPPAGMCRIWIDGVPPAHQPAPTDCATAIRKRPMNARVVFGSDAPTGNAPSGARSFTPAQPPQSNFVSPSSSSPREEPAHIAQPQLQQQQQQMQQQRDEQERLRIEAQRVHDEQEKRASHHEPPPPPPPPPQPPLHQSREHTAQSQSRPRVEKTTRPPHQSFSPRRQR